MSELPMNWEEISLLEISDFVRGVTYTKSDISEAAKEGFIPVLRANNIQRDFDFDDLIYVSESRISENQKIKAGDVVIATSSGSINVVGKAVQAKTDLDAGFGAFCGLLRPSKCLHSKYFGHFFASDFYRKSVSSMARGVNINNLKPSHFNEISIPLAPIEEQKRIADKLDQLLARVDACRERLDRIPVFLKRFRQAVLAAATSGQLTEDWRESVGCASRTLTNPDTAEGAQCAPYTVIPIKELITDIRYGTSKKCDYEVHDGIPVLRIPNISENGRLDGSDLKFALFDKKEREKLALKKGDILIIRSNGSVDLVGKAAVVDSSFEGYLYAGYLIRLRSDITKIIPQYLWIFLSSPEIRSYIELISRSTAGVNNINSEEIQAIEVQTPSLAEQQEIIRRVEKLFAYADRLEARYRQARAQVDRLAPALLAKAFRGELVPQDPNDEPASALLERLRAERASDTTPAKPRKRGKAAKSATA